MTDEGAGPAALGCRGGFGSLPRVHRAPRSDEDLAALERIRASLTQRVRSGLTGGTWTAAGESHWLVIPELSTLRRARPAYGIGFFGQVREHVDHAPILELEQDLLARADVFRGLLAYYNVQFANRQWGNLVLFAGEDDPASLRSDPTHLDALARAAHHYRSVRLHRLRQPGRGGRATRASVTGRPWHAAQRGRHLSRGLLMDKR